MDLKTGQLEQYPMLLTIFNVKSAIYFHDKLPEVLFCPVKYVLVYL